MDKHKLNNRPIEQELADYLVGQNDAINRVAPYIYSHVAGLTAQGRPIANILLLGPSGSGKTKLAEAMAKVLHKSEKNLLKVDCGEFQMEHEVAKLIGAPPGYLGHRETQPLFSQARINAVASEESEISIILFDEIEKAASSMHRLLLGLLDKATLRLGDNSTVNFERCIILMTSNLGVETMNNLSEASYLAKYTTDSVKNSTETLSEAAIRNTGMRAVKKKFSPEFIGRLDDIIVYNPLSEEAITKILKIQLRETQLRFDKSLGNRSISLTYEPSALKYLVDNGFSKDYGARQLKHLINSDIITPIGYGLCVGDIKARERLIVSYDGRSKKLKFVSAVKKSKSVA